MTREFELPPYDGDQAIDADWLSQWAVKQPHVWDIPGTALFLYHEWPRNSGFWSIGEELDDGDETTLCYVRECRELDRILDLLIVNEDDERPPDYPNWDRMTDAEKNETLRKAI